MQRKRREKQLFEERREITIHAYVNAKKRKLKLYRQTFYPKIQFSDNDRHFPKVVKASVQPSKASCKGENEKRGVRVV